MAGGLIFGHSLCSVGSSFFLLRPLELGFGLGALLRLVGHGFLLEEIATTRRGIFERHRQADKRDPVVVYSNRFSCQSAGGRSASQSTAGRVQVSGDRDAVLGGRWAAALLRPQHGGVPPRLWRLLPESGKRSWTTCRRPLTNFQCRLRSRLRLRLLLRARVPRLSCRRRSSSVLGRGLCLGTPNCAPACGE